MKLLSLDMSTRRTGWAVFDNDKLIAYNLIENEYKDPLWRVSYMFIKIQELIKLYNIDCIVCEDVPVSTHSNLDVGKWLCVLQGVAISLKTLYKIDLHCLHPTHWRVGVGLHKTKYICNVCGHEEEDVSAKKDFVCSQCGNNKKTKFKKEAINDRESLKMRAIEMANEKFDLNLNYFYKNSKRNDDDIAEAILIGCSFLKENDDKCLKKEKK